LSFTEFSYQLLQAYDFQCLYSNRNTKFQMGGSDQWGNITSGTEFIRKNIGGHAFAVTTPLLTKSDGKKFGKSEKGNLWLDPKLTSPYDFYQFWINIDDKDTASFTRYFTLKSKEEIEAREKEHGDNPQMLKKLLAEELTRRVHSDEDYEAVLNVSNLLFRKATKETLLSLTENNLVIVANELQDKSYTIAKDVLQNGINIVDLLAEHTNILSSKSDARRQIKGNAIAVNKDKISSHETAINQEALLHGKYIMVENGKKNKYMLIVE